MRIASILLIILSFCANAQNYDSYFLGNSQDASTSPTGGICLMGGATENDEAMKWFLQRADGGDILVIRASGSDGYNDYLLNQLGVTINSVETIVFNDATASNETYIHQRINQAEGIWIAGGDQWNYVSYWRNTPIDSLINKGITERNIVIGGTSAGMAIQGGIYFTAENGTITSNDALMDPYNTNATIDSASFIQNSIISEVITDTHYDNPDRKGRHTSFIAKAIVEYGLNAKGIACDEYTAVCISTSGIASVYGEYPTYDDNAYFIQANCEINPNLPENCTTGTPLNWIQNNAALKVYQIKGTSNGANTFDLNDWLTGTGGTWNNWWVNNGVFYENPSTAPICSVSTIHEEDEFFVFYPTLFDDHISIHVEGVTARLIDLNGKVLIEEKNNLINTTKLLPGYYILELHRNGKLQRNRVLKL
jgi:cyanophycinase-like exopeptidase